MDTNEILKRNVRALLRHYKQTIREAVDAAVKRGVPITNGTLGRVHKGEYVGTEKVADVAATFNLQPWQILVPGLNPAVPPELGDASAQRKAIADHVRKALEPFMFEEPDTEPAPLDEPPRKTPPPKPKREQMLPTAGAKKKGRP